MKITKIKSNDDGKPWIPQRCTCSHCRNCLMDDEQYVMMYIGKKMDAISFRLKGKNFVFLEFILHENGDWNCNTQIIS